MLEPARVDGARALEPAPASILSLLPGIHSSLEPGERSSSSRPIRLNDAAPTYLLCVSSYSPDASSNVSSSQEKETEEGADDSNRMVEDEGDLGLELCGAEAWWVEALSIEYPASPSVRWAPHLHRAEDEMHRPDARVPARRWRSERAGDGEWRGTSCDGRPRSHR
ncbi:hypothetical protein D1007_43060 [Hordeum vulgare]|nr:hypothetical protein D1007_43060 [Hordeum vulgare]